MQTKKQNEQNRMKPDENGWKRMKAGESRSKSDEVFLVFVGLRPDLEKKMELFRKAKVPTKLTISAKRGRKKSEKQETLSLEPKN